MRAPGYWPNETSGRLRPAVEAYLNDHPMSVEYISAIRAYLRQWIEADGFCGPAINDLRGMVADLTTREAIDRWLDLALEEGIDPL